MWIYDWNRNCWGYQDRWSIQWFPAKRPGLRGLIARWLGIE